MASVGKKIQQKDIIATRRNKFILDFLDNFISAKLLVLGFKEDKLFDKLFILVLKIFF